MAEWNDIERHIDKISADNDGRLTAELLYEHARCPTDPLHSECVWDPDEAIREANIERMRGILRRYIVIKRVREQRTEVDTINVRTYDFVRKYVRDVTAPPGEQGYVSTNALAETTDTVRKEQTVDYYMRQAIGCLRTAVGVASSVDCMHVVHGYRDLVKSLMD